MAVVGIDLGTTFSVIATPQLFEGKYFDVARGITIIKDDFNQRLTPSVVATDRQGNLLVGRRAKARAGQQPEPIMFVKRHMGEDKPFPLGGQTLQPEDVSAEILRYLKEMAETQMGEAIEEAVITVPAYFTTGQKQKTKEAGEKAGLRVGEIVQEPVAAALAYCAEDGRDPLTIMTYDLGGGTFDVAILRKEGGVFDIKAFDGNRHLGGYDFDKKLADWIIGQIQKQGYQFDDDTTLPAYRMLFTKLLVLAETAKIQLSSRQIATLVEDTAHTDARGEPISFDLEITRDTFTGLIAADIEETMRLCRRALEKAGMTAANLDEIVMVGGSTRIPLVAERLEAEFGKKPQLSEPDLSVAIGAAIMARRLGRRVGPLTLGNLPETTTLLATQITGVLAATEQAPQVGGCVAILMPADGSQPQRQTVNENGGFIFPRVPLQPEAANTFSLRLETAAGEEIVSHRFTIHHQADAPTQTVAGMQPNVLARPISIMTKNGLQTVVAERTPLPYECRVPAQTADQTGEVHIPVYEDTCQIGEIVVTGLPQTLEVGNRVDITLTLRDDFYIDGRAHIPAANVTAETTIQIPPVVVKGIDELRRLYQALEARKQEALAQADAGRAFEVAPQVNRVLATCRRLLYEERDPNLAKAQELLAEAETLLRQLRGWQPEPPKEQFEQMRREIERELLPELQRRQPGSEYASQLPAIIQLAERALQEKSDAGWVDANKRLAALREHILTILAEEERKRKIQDGGQPPREEPPDPRVIKLKLGMDLSQLRAEAERRGRLAELAADFDACDQELKAIDPSSSDAMLLLANYYENKHQPLQARVMGMGKGRDTLPEGLVQILADQQRYR
jgi:molecular chaperone DnaK (HSP70)